MFVKFLHAGPAG